MVRLPAYGMRLAMRQRTFLRLTSHDWLQIMGIWLVATALIAGVTFTQIRHERQQAQQTQRQEQQTQRRPGKHAGWQLHDMMT
jgi:uncharacterized protein HemX